MVHFEERIIAGLTVRIDRTLCVGFADCVALAPGIFVLDADGIAVFGDALNPTRELLLEACDACPVDAITVLTDDGRQLVP